MQHSLVFEYGPAPSTFLLFFALNRRFTKSEKSAIVLCLFLRYDEPAGKQKRRD